MRIEQCYVCNAIKAFKARIFKKYNFVEYTNTKEPVIFFGCYNQKNLAKILSHDPDSLVVLVWRGSDAQALQNIEARKGFAELFQRKNVKHIAISSFVAQDLKLCGVPYIFLPISHVPVEQFKPTELGSKIYIYNYGQKCLRYGQSIIDEVLASLKDIEILPTAWGKYSPAEMQNIYKQCFIGLRPIKHDGLSNTVVELGLMGRRCIYNGELPNAIHWKGASDIVTSIREEYKRVGQRIDDVAKKMLEYINISDDWLNTEYYGFG